MATGKANKSKKLHRAKSPSLEKQMTLGRKRLLKDKMLSNVAKKRRQELPNGEKTREFLFFYSSVVSSQMCLGIF